MFYICNLFRNAEDGQNNKQGVQVISTYCLRVREKITLQFMALRFRLDLVELIELNRKHSLSYVEDSANEDRTKMA